MTVQMDIAALHDFIATEFATARGYVVDHVGEMEITVRLPVDERHLRPGGTISGPTMFSLADVTVYLALLAQIGPKALAVTTNCSIDFMRKPKADANLRAEARLLKLGRALAVGDVLIYSEGEEAPVARASLTYSIPPER